MVTCCGYEVTTDSILSRISLFFFGLSASGWFTFAVGFLSNVFSFDPVVRALSFLFVPWWIALILGPIVYILGGLYLFLGGIPFFGKLFRTFTGFAGIMYVAALSAPLFLVATLIATAIGAVNDIINVISIPTDIIEDAIDLGPANVLVDGLGDAVSFITDFVRGILYFLLVVLFEKFLSQMRSQLVGSVSAVLFLMLSMMTWPFYRPTLFKKSESKT